MKEQLRQILQRRLDILREEAAFFPADSGIEPEQLLRETVEEDLAIARVDGNEKEIEQWTLALSLLDELT
ncbi:MAG: hypothetical protein GXY53_10900 [Desulfobulbus sp.]|nr:hypothetical protein [Desulfobulbus sp.]